MSTRHYLQTMGPKPTLRRYHDDGTAERWDDDMKRWSYHCAPEGACLATGDKVISKDEADEFVTKP